MRRFAGELGIDGDRLALWGESAGGHLAALLALVDDPDLIGTSGVGEGDTAVRAGVDYYGVSDIAAMPGFFDRMPPHILEAIRATGQLREAPFDVLFRGSPYPRAEAERLASPTAHARSDAPPFLRIHGEADGGVPIGQSELLQAAVPGSVSRCQLHAVRERHIRPVVTPPHRGVVSSRSRSHGRGPP